MKPELKIIMFIIILCGIIDIALIRMVIVEKRKYLKIKKEWDKLPRVQKRLISDN